MFNKIQRLFLTILVIIIPVHSFATEENIDLNKLGFYLTDEESHEKIAAMGDDIIPKLNELFDRSGPNIKLGVVKVLRRMGGARSKEAMIDILEQFCARPLSGKEWHHVPEEELLKKLTLFELKETGEGGLAVVSERLQTAGGEFRKCLIIGSGFLGDSTYYDSIVEILESDANPYLRALSARALGKIGDKKAIPKLEKALKDEFYFDITGYSPGEDILIEPGDPLDVEYPVREAAIHGLSDMGVKVNRKWHDMWIGDKIPPGIANKPYTPPPGLTNKPAPPGQEKKQ